MLLRRTRILIFRTVKAFFDDGCSQRAAALSYYVLFSLFSLLIFSVAIIGLFLQDESLQQDLVNEIMDNIPLSQEEGRDDVTQALENVTGGQSGAIGLVGLIGLAWSGSALFGVLRSSLNVVFEAEQSRPLVIQKLVDLRDRPLLHTLLRALHCRHQRAARRQAHQRGPRPGRGRSSSLGHRLGNRRLPHPVLISFVAFFLVYWLVPARRLQPRYLVPGALLAAVLFEVVKVGFNIYLENFSNYDVVFGSLGAVVAFLFWVFLSANTILFGAELASEVPGVAAGLYDQPSGPTRPQRSLGKKVLRLARSLVQRQPGEKTPAEDSVDDQEGAGPPPR